MFRTSFRTLATNSNGVNRINQYDHKAIHRNKMQTRVVVREKPFLQSRKERIWEWMKPKHHMGDSLVDGLELFKIGSLIVMPLFMIGVWKVYQTGAHAAVENKTKGLQAKPLIEDDESHSQNTDYFSVIDKFQERREAALQKKQSSSGV